MRVNKSDFAENATDRLVEDVAGGRVEVGNVEELGDDDGRENGVVGPLGKGADGGEGKDGA